MSTKKCEMCGSVLFEVIPFETTQQEIVEFARRSKLEDKETAISSRWMHPGFYCPNGCHVTFVEVPIELPEMSIDQAIHYGQRYSQKHHLEFLETHSETSRIGACVYCDNFAGAAVEGHSQTYRYHNPKLKPLGSCKIIKAFCKVPQIQAIDRAWWYDKGQNQPECDFFKHNSLFIYKYKEITGWSEFPEKH